MKPPSLDINRDDLATEWQGQASLMLHWGLQLADATAAAARAKANLSAVEANLDADIRNNPAAYDVAKVTVDSVRCAIIGTADHAMATEDYIAATYEESVARAVVNAVAHRKSALSGLTDLWLREYYADPRTPDQPTPLREAAGDTTKRTRNRRRRRDSDDDTGEGVGP
jgi:hypothetical protein